jgi:hypothetical protein
VIIARQSAPIAAAPLSPFPATLTHRSQLAENPITLSLLFAALTNCVTSKSFACRSYRKLSGVGQCSQSIPPYFPIRQTQVATNLPRNSASNSNPLNRFRTVSVTTGIGAPSGFVVPRDIDLLLALRTPTPGYFWKAVQVKELTEGRCKTSERKGVKASSTQREISLRPQQARPEFGFDSMDAAPLPWMFLFCGFPPLWCQKPNPVE